MIAAREDPRPCPATALQEIPARSVRTALAGRGLWFDYGAATLRVRSDSAALASQLRAVYHGFPFVDDGAWADLHVDIERPRKLRRWLAPQVTFRCDGRRPFAPFPSDSPLPLLEWGSNWLIGQRLNDLLLLHAGAVERDGLALLLPALPGSGKSTLTAALSLRGWRLLSDEFGAFDPETRSFRAMLKPIALKNESIDVIRRFAPDARLGPLFPKTRKGTVAHLGAEGDASRVGTSAHVRRGDPAPLGSRQSDPAHAVAGRPPVYRTRLQCLQLHDLGADGFAAAIGLVRRCPAWTLAYSDLGDAIRAIDAVWPLAIERQADTAVREAEAST